MSCLFRFTLFKFKCFIFPGRVGEGLIFGTMMVGQAMAFAPNYNKAKVSGARILRLLDRRPAIDSSPGVGLQIVRNLIPEES